MSDPSINFNRAVFAKTDIGRQEMQTHSLRLPPLVRRLLVLVDGKRTGKELAPLMGGQDLAGLLQQLLEKDCVQQIDAATTAAPAAAPAPPPATQASSTDLVGLPAPDSRSDKDTDMARNFMINTLNMAFGQHMCTSLIETVSNCRSAAEVRQSYPDWKTTMESSRLPAAELVSLRDKLFKVL